jgi:phosphoribosyl 1,2-cyclic phosphodiesterase
MNEPVQAGGGSRPDDDGFSVTFWGTRGSIACPGPDTVRYGGNTTCLEIRCGGDVVIVDGGTGMRGLGRKLVHETPRPTRLDILFTHTHFDHVVGVPFFQPAYHDTIHCTFWAGHLLPEATLRGILVDMMMPPLFPVPLNIFESCEYRDFTAGERFELRPGIGVATCRLNHPNGATGYRIEYRGRAIAVITDTEHTDGELDPAVVDLVAGADVMIYDSMFTDEELPRFRGWGHSTWQHCLRVAEAAGVARPVIFHHDPNHDDAFMDGIAAAAAERHPGSLVAREGQCLAVLPGT